VGAPGPDLQFDATDGLQEAILRRIMVVDVLPPSWELDAPLRRECRERIRLAMSTLAAIDPGIHRSVTMLIGSFLFARLRHFGGGSNSSVIGCVWLNPSPDWSAIDWLENILHEYVHQCLFMEDMRHGLFVGDGELLAQEGALVRSALLEKPRPYDRAFHSSFVSFVLMQLDLLMKKPERVTQHVEPLRTTLGQLLDKSRYLSPHGILVLQSLAAAFDDFRSTHAPEIGLC